MAANRRLTERFIEFPVHRTSPHFRTNRVASRLAAAFVASLTLHLLPALPELISPAAKPSTAAPPPLHAELRPPAAALPPLQLPEPPAPAKPPPAKPKPPPPAEKSGKAPVPWTQAVKRHLQQLQASGQFYPAEAIAAGLQGEVDVLLVIDESGKVVAARVERGSGHAILDDAALRAVRSLTSLPADAPRQAVLPVRFRLR